MPEIKLKHVVSFSSEDKVHKAENLIQPETYRKWKCSTPGEKNATVVLQFEKASQIHSIDIGNESSAFVEVLVGRSSDNLNNFQVILVASSFMSPIESRNETHTNRVRMFGPEKLSQNVKDEKWDCVQIVCTQPFNKNISYGLSFIKFHSPPEKVTETPKNSEAESTTTKIGAFRLKTDDEEDSPPVGFLFGKQKTLSSDDKQKDKFSQKAPSYAASVLASSSITTKEFSKNTPSKRKSDDKNTESNEPPSKKSPGSGLNKDYIVYKNLDLNKNNKIASGMDNHSSKNATSNKRPATNKSAVATDKPSTSSKPEKVKKKVPFGKIMKNVVFVLSGFVNPMRSELRDKALEMGAKYKADWDKSSTHLVCAFINTPKYVQVRGQDGIVVTKEWILDCYKKKALLPWKDYKLGSYNISGSSAEESETPDEDELQVIMNSRTNGTKSPKNKSPSKQNTPVNSSAKKQPARIAFLNEQSNSKDGSETEDEDALEDYMADTDVESNSGGDTEDEIRKVENKAKRKAHASPAKNSRAIKEASPLAQKPNVDDLPLPELPNLFKGRRFFLFGDFTSSKHHELQRYITAYNGVIEDYMSDTVKYVISEAKWDKNFEDALSENEDLIFAKPLWIYKCHESGKLVPYQPYIIIPDS